MIFSHYNRMKKMDKKYNKRKMKKYNPVKNDGKMKAIQKQIEKEKKSIYEENNL